MTSDEPAQERAAARLKLEEHETAVTAALHALAQPLTALCFVLDLASLRSEPETWWQAVETGRIECRRAIAALEQVRAAAMPETQLVQQRTAGWMGESW